MQSVHTVSVRPHRGAPRVWLQGMAAQRAGFLPGMKFTLEGVPGTRQLLVRLSPAGERTVSRKTYSSGREVPVLDINSAQDLAVLQGCEVVRVLVTPGTLVLSPLASEQRRQRRLKRALTRLRRREPLRTAGICAGAGILSHAMHAGLADAQVNSQLVLHNELRADLGEQAWAYNELVGAHTQVLQMPLQELAFDESVLQTVAEVDLVEVGLPCSGASLAGRAKRGIPVPEAHPEVGHLVVAALALVARLNPLACLFENVVPYASTASAFLLRHQLRDLGYHTQECQVYGPDYGELEARRRWCLVAVTQGIEFDLSELNPRTVDGPPRQLGDVLEDPESPGLRWDRMEGLKAKALRDRLAGKGFKMQVFEGSAQSIGTLTKGLAKNRTTDPKIRHPLDPQLLRVPSAREHARCKGVPEHLITGLVQSQAHELLGQSIVYRPFRQLAAHLGAALRAWASVAAPETAQSMPILRALKAVG